MGPPSRDQSVVEIAAKQAPLEGKKKEEKHAVARINEVGFGMYDCKVGYMMQEISYAYCFVSRMISV